MERQQFADEFKREAAWRRQGGDFEGSGDQWQHASSLGTGTETFKDECLNTHWFESLREAKMKIALWQQEYNESRPHRALGETAPAEFAHQHWMKQESRRENTADD